MKAHNCFELSFEYGESHFFKNIKLAHKNVYGIGFDEEGERGVIMCNIQKRAMVHTVRGTGAKFTTPIFSLFSVTPIESLLYLYDFNNKRNPPLV